MERKNSFLENIFSVRNDERNHKVLTVFGVKVKLKRKIKETSKIKSKEISVVVQGAINKDVTPRCLKSIRKFLPDAEIILSTWEGSDVEGLDYDKLVLNKDPGAFWEFPQRNVRQCNLNRQILSTYNGMQEASRVYALKIRTDFFLIGNNFLNFYNKFIKYNADYKIFENRIICNMTMSYNPRKIAYRKHRGGECHFPFHPSDFTLFATTKDLLNLFNIPLASDEHINYFIKYPNIVPKSAPANQYHAEQYLWINCLKKNGKNILCKYSVDYDENIAEQSEQFFVNNYFPVAFKQFGVMPYKDDLKLKNKITFLAECYTQRDWMKLYKKYCDVDFRIPIISLENYVIKLANKIYKNKDSIMKDLFLKIIKNLIELL